MKRKPLITILSAIIFCLISLMTVSCQSKGNNPELSGLVEKRWIVAELYGKTLSAVYTAGQEPRLTLRTVDNTISGSGGCNTIYGKYTTIEKNHISFSDLSTTKMFCDNMNDETSFLQALRSAGLYSVARDTLILKDVNGTLLAKLHYVAGK